MKTKLTPLFVDFFESEKASGIVLIVCTLLSMVIANSHFGTAYLDFWHVRVGLEIPNIVVLHHNLERWVNDGLMAIFFLLIGLEIEREIYIGELSSPKQASLPMAAAIGGMLVPALLHFFQPGHGDNTPCTNPWRF